MSSPDRPISSSPNGDPTLSDEHAELSESDSAQPAEPILPGNSANAEAPRTEDGDPAEGEKSDTLEATKDPTDVDTRSMEELLGDPDMATLERAREGDESAFEEIVLAFQDAVFSKIYYMTHDRTLAEDLSQETFLRVYLGLSSFRGESKLRTWIYRISVNVVLHHFEKMNAQKRRGHVVSIHGGSSGADGGERQTIDLADQRNLPDEIAVNRERRAKILAAVAELPEEFRLVLALRELEKQSYQEIGASLDLPMGTVKSKIFRARQILQEKLEGIL